MCNWKILENWKINTRFLLSSYIKLSFDSQYLLICPIRRYSRKSSEASVPFIPEQNHSNENQFRSVCNHDFHPRWRNLGTILGNVGLFDNRMATVALPHERSCTISTYKKINYSPDLISATSLWRQMEPIVRIWEIDSLKYIHRRFIISLATAEMQSLLSRFSCLSHGPVLLTLWGPQSFRLFSRHRWTLSPYRVNKFLFRICIGNMHVRSNSLKQDYEGNCLRAKIIIFPDNFIESGWFYVLELYFYSSGHNFRFWCFFLFYFFLFYLRPMLDSSYVNLAQGMWINDLKKLIQLLINDKFNFFHFFPKLSIFKLRFLESNNLNCWFWLDHAEILYFKRNAIESWNRSLLLLFHLNCLTRNDWMK